jgi:hypothetical protein
VINHLFLVPNLEEAIAKWKAAGATVEMAESAYSRNPLGWAYTPDDLKLRITPDTSLYTPLARPGIQMPVPADSIPDLPGMVRKGLRQQSRAKDQ